MINCFFGKSGVVGNNKSEWVEFNAPSDTVAQVILEPILTAAYQFSYNEK